MSATEILVVVFGLFIGYWIVIKFSGSRPEPVQQYAEPESEHEHEQAQWRKDKSGERTENRTPYWYEVLQISPGADLPEIRGAYRSLMSQYHPDKVASLGPELRELCERKSKEINTAYEQAMRERGAAPA